MVQDRFQWQALVLEVLNIRLYCGMKCSVFIKQKDEVYTADTYDHSKQATLP